MTDEERKAHLLYYVRVDDGNDTAYKIGITRRSVSERFGADIDKITVINVSVFSSEQEARIEEARILTKYAGIKWQGRKLLSEGGNTELFTHDVYSMDTNKGHTLNNKKGRNSSVIRCTNCGYKYNTSSKWVHKFKINLMINGVACHGCDADNSLRLNEK